MVRRGHQQRGHRRQLQRLRLGAVHRADQRPDGRVRGRLPHPVRGRDHQEPAQLHRRTPRRRGQRQGPGKTPRSLRRAKATHKPHFILELKSWFLTQNGV